MSKHTFDLALAKRRNAGLAHVVDELTPFLDLCRHAMARQAFATDSLAWSASQEPVALSVLHHGEPIWTALRADGAGFWLVGHAGVADRMTRAEAMQDLMQTLAASATMLDRVRFTWRSDGTIGGTF